MTSKYLTASMLLSESVSYGALDTLSSLYTLGNTSVMKCVPKTQFMGTNDLTVCIWQADHGLCGSLLVQHGMTVSKLSRKTSFYKRARSSYL